MLDSVRGFVRLWAVFTLLILLYAWLDLRSHPQLLRETQLSLKPDLRQLADLQHWGGRLLKHNALGLLLGNAVILAGVSALFGRSVFRALRRLLVSKRDSGEAVPSSILHS